MPVVQCDRLVKMMLLHKLLVYGFVLYVGVFTNEEATETEYEDYNAENNVTNTGTLEFTKKLSNITRDSGQNITLQCAVRSLDANISLSKIRLKWQINDAPVKESKRITVRRNEELETRLVTSRLKIINLEIHDTGFYTCIASNGKNKIRSTFLLKVPREMWTSTSLDLPTFDPVFPDTPSLDPDFTTIQPNQQSIDRIVRDDMLPIDPKPTFPKAFTNTQQNMLNNFSINEPFCQIYKGGTCKEFLQDKYVFVQPPFTQKYIEEKLKDAFVVISFSKDLSTHCESFALPSLCYSAFPICIDEQQINIQQQNVFAAKISNAPIDKVGAMFKNIRNELPLRRICKDDCELLENELCRAEYAIAKEHPVIGKTLQLEECVNLPEQLPQNSQYCLPLGIDRSQYLQIDDDCYWGKGETYRGVQDVSGNNTKCLKWAHQLQVQLAGFPELSGGHSYCRNPGGLEDEPFCFVDQNRRELCNVPKCATYMWIYISIAFVAFTVIGIGAILYFCCVRNRNKQNPRSLQNMNIPTADKNIYGNSRMNSPMELNPMLPPQGNNIPPMRNQNPNKNNFQNVPNYTYKEVSFVEELGEGAFGKVYKGELKTKSGKMFVAVKALKENASAKTQADFQREIDLISELRHPNIICLLGIIVKQEPMCMLFEFMSEGDLHEFLRTNSPSEGKSLSQNEFLHIALQIALGMEYLSSNHYVHRDLAARNCLVSKDLVVKISDFGLSRDMYSCDYYRVQSKSLLPVRWMPPESILYGKFTTESDVWSYGVVLWEIYSYGLQPYYGYNNQEVINMIRSRKLLPCPEYCPSYCYSLMVECWAELAIRRPSFPEICHRLRVWKQNGVQMTGAYFKTADKNAQKYGHSSKSHSFEEPEPSLTWDRKLSSHNLNESQSSLTSRTSSLGNKTQSTNVSAEQPSSRGSKKAGAERKPHRHRKEQLIAERTEPVDLKAKNTVVNSNGDNFETMLSY